MAWLDEISVESSDGYEAAARVYERYGAVRVLDAVSSRDCDALLRQGITAGVVADAFGQGSRSDRFTVLLRGDAARWKGDGSDDVDDSRGANVLDRLAPKVSEFLGDETSLWRRVCGGGVVSLAELVVSCPGGAAQNWHYDGIGATAQVALVDVDVAMGPTEVVPRAMPPEYTEGGVRHARAPYDLKTLASRVVWAALRPYARRLVAARDLLPATARLAAPKGAIVIYDSAMLHRGGKNRSAERRPIMALHVRHPEAERTPDLEPPRRRSADAPVLVTSRPWRRRRGAAP